MSSASPTLLPAYSHAVGKSMGKKGARQLEDHELALIAAGFQLNFAADLVAGQLLRLRDFFQIAGHLKEMKVALTHEEMESAIAKLKTGTFAHVAIGEVVAERAL